MFEKEGLFLGEVGVGGFEVDELGDGQAVLDEVGTVGGESLFCLVELVLGLEEEEIVGCGDEDEAEADFS